MLPREERECRDSKRDRGPGPSAASAVNPGQVGGLIGTRLVECNAARAAIEVLAGYPRAATTTAKIRIQNACHLTQSAPDIRRGLLRLSKGPLGPVWRTSLAQKPEPAVLAGRSPGQSRSGTSSGECAVQDCGCIGQLTVGGSIAVIIGRGLGMQSKSRLKLAAREMFYCTKCGHLMHQNARACPQCGAPSSVQGWSDISDRSRLTALLLCIFLGIFGVHRFYVGRMAT